MNDLVYLREVCKKDDGSIFTITRVRCHLPIHGRWATLSISALCDGSGELAMTYLFAPMDRDSETLRGDIFQANPSALLRLDVGENGHRRSVDQALNLREAEGKILGWTDVGGEGTVDTEAVNNAREFCRIVLTKLESIVETARVHLRKELGGDLRQKSLDLLVKRYGDSTAVALNSFLGEINWSFMLHPSGCVEQFLDIVNATMLTHEFDWYGIDFNGDTGIDLLRPDEVDRFRNRDVASARAASMLKHVLGDDLSAEFEARNHVTVVANGYKFVIAPGAWIQCTDPDGKRAELCIHTVGMSCNVIDEVVIAYLHIRHRFDEYMGMAVVWNADDGFSKEKREAA